MLSEEQQRTLYERVEEADRVRRALGDHWRRWPELGWAASAQGLPVAELGERLLGAGGLDARIRQVLAEWREVDAAQAALAEEVRTLPGCIAAWRERPVPEPLQDEPGVLDPDHPLRRA